MLRTLFAHRRVVLLLGILGAVPPTALAGQTLQQAKLTPLMVTPPDTLARAFGHSVSIDGHTIVVGAYGRNEAGLVDSGAAHVFVRNVGAGTWSGQARLLPSIRHASAQFAFSVAISGDTIVAGCNNCTVDAQGGRGAAFVFTRSGSTWSQVGSHLSIGSGNENFGHSVAIDGSTLVVGAPNADVGGRVNEGLAYVYVSNAGVWTLQDTVMLPAGQANDNFGKSVAIRGNRLAVGASGDDVAVANQGEVYIYERVGADWLLQPNMPLFVAPPDGQNPDALGSAVSLSPSGDLLLAGAPGADYGESFPVGAAYLFAWNGSSWTLQRKFSPFSPNQQELFGFAVAITDETVLIGAYNEHAPATGAGTAYQFDRTGPSVWTAVPPQYSPTDSQTSQNFGRSVALSGDTAVVGAWFHDVPPYTDMGAVYVYTGLPTSVSFDPPTLVYAPVANTSVTVSATVNGTPGAAISVTPTGGSTGATRSLNCIAPAGYTAQVVGSPFVGGGSAGQINISCPTTGPAPGNLTCTESPGSVSRIWPLTCSSEPLFFSDPRPSSVLAAYGAIGEDFTSATLAIENRGTASLSLTGCTETTGSPFGLEVTTPIDPAGIGSIAIDCTVPPIGTTLAGSIRCNTNDPRRPLVLYKIFCVAPPAAIAGASASPIARLAGSVPDPGARIGASTSIGTDGATGAEILLVGAPHQTDDGRVLLFTRMPGSQTAGASGLARPDAVLRARPTSKRTAGVLGNKFGSAMAVSPDGTRIAIGAPAEGTDGAGRVLIFSRPPGGWPTSELDPTAAAVIEAPVSDGVSAAGFGSKLAFGPDNTLAVAAPDSMVDAIQGAGMVYLFDQSLSGQAVRPPQPAASTGFGSALDLRAGMLAVGAPGEAANTGAAYVYETAGNGVGAPQRYSAQGGSPGDKWGASVAVMHDSIAVGAPFDDTTLGTDSGSATLMRRLGGTTLGAGTVLVPQATGTQGAGAALATNGELLVVGAPLSGSPGQARRGRALVYDIESANLGGTTPLGTYENAIGEEADEFGSSVAVSRVRILVGAPLGDEGIDENEGRADPFVLDRVSRLGFER